MAAAEAGSEPEELDLSEVRPAPRAPPRAPRAPPPGRALAAPACLGLARWPPTLARSWDPPLHPQVQPNPRVLTVSRPLLSGSTTLEAPLPLTWKCRLQGAQCQRAQHQGARGRTPCPGGGVPQIQVLLDLQ